jgi:polysaccharide export outer membrane protein
MGKGAFARKGEIMSRVSIIVAVFLLIFFGGLPAFGVDQDYVVGEGDVLKVMVYDNPDLETIARVSGKGTILFPLVGEVAIKDMTVSEIVRIVARKLSDGYILDPQVSVFVEEFRSKRAIIMGEVKDPGLYELSGRTSIMELISKAGGLTLDAGDKATIKRKNPANSGQDDLISVNLKNLMEEQATSPNVAIRDGDSVFIARAGIFYVTGHVNKPDAYKLDTETSVIKAITMAGGFSELAAQNRVRVIRHVDGVEKVLEKVPMHMPVQPEDVIVVPESFF